MRGRACAARGRSPGQRRRAPEGNGRAERAARPAALADAVGVEGMRDVDDAARGDPAQPAPVHRLSGDPVERAAGPRRHRGPRVHARRHEGREPTHPRHTGRREPRARSARRAGSRRAAGRSPRRTTHRRRSCPATCRSRPSWPGKSISCARSCSTPRSRGISDVGGDPGFARPSFIYLSARHIGILTAGRSSRQPIRPRKHGPRLARRCLFLPRFRTGERDVLHPAHRPPGPPRQARRPFRAKISPCPNLPDSRYSHIPRNTIPPASIHGNSYEHDSRKPPDRPEGRYRLLRRLDTSAALHWMKLRAPSRTHTRRTSASPTKTITTRSRNARSNTAQPVPA